MSQLRDIDSPPAKPDPPGSESRLDDLAQIIRAYNEVTEKLQASHETLKAEVHRLRRELASSNAQLQRSKRLSALGEMAAGIAHEIRNPLAAIQLYARMVFEDVQQAGPSLGDAADNTEKIAAAVRRLNSIVNDVLFFSREIQPRTQALCANRMFAAAVEDQRPALEAAGVAVLLDHARDRDLRLEADADLLHQALVNLIRNAVDAMNAVDRRVLSLEASREDQAIVLRVRDTGPGIAKQNIDRIFNPFFTTRNTGTGLGLAIVHRIVDAHGGSVVVNNDGGAVFELTLPAAGQTPAPVATQPAALPIGSLG